MAQAPQVELKKRLEELLSKDKYYFNNIQFLRTEGEQIFVSLNLGILLKHRNLSNVNKDLIISSIKESENLKITPEGTETDILAAVDKYAVEYPIKSELLPNTKLNLARIDSKTAFSVENCKELFPNASITPINDKSVFAKFDSLDDIIAANEKAKTKPDLVFVPSSTSNQHHLIYLAYYPGKGYYTGNNTFSKDVFQKQPVKKSYKNRNSKPASKPAAAPQKPATMNVDINFDIKACAFIQATDYKIRIEDIETGQMFSNITCFKFGTRNINSYFFAIKFFNFLLKTYLF